MSSFEPTSACTHLVFPLILVPKDCFGHAEIAFVLDSSGSLRDEDFSKVKSFVKRIASSFELSPSLSRAGIVSYSDDAVVNFRLQDTTDLKSFHRSVDAIPHQRGRTRIDKALQAAYRGIFQDARSYAPKVAVVLTDGEQTPAGDAVPLDVAVRPLTDMGVEVYAVGVGDKVNVNELKAIAGTNVILSKSFDELHLYARKMGDDACKSVGT